MENKDILENLDQLNILYLPREINEKIISLLKYENIAHLRVVCKQFDSIAQGLLNRGLIRVDKKLNQIQRKLKSALPRRESERRQHALSRHIDVLGSIETRLSLLTMTYMKYIDCGACCFIPGKVLDELLKLLYYVESVEKVARSHELLQELRDISSMAMEHFDEHIVPTLKVLVPACNSSLSLRPLISGANGECFRETNMTAALTQSSRIISLPMAKVKKEMAEFQLKFIQQRKKIQDMEKKINDDSKTLSQHKTQMDDQEINLTLHKCRIDQQERLITHQKSQLDLQENFINDLRRRSAEQELTLGDMFAEITKFKKFIPIEDSNERMNNISDTDQNIAKRKHDSQSNSEDEIISNKIPKL